MLGLRGPSVDLKEPYAGPSDNLPSGLLRDLFALVTINPKCSLESPLKASDVAPLALKVLTLENPPSTERGSLPLRVSLCRYESPLLLYA